MAFANTSNQNLYGFVDDSDLSLPFAAPSRFESMTHNLFNGMEPLSADTGAFTNVADPQFSVNQDLIDLSRVDYKGPVFAHSIPDETPMWTFNAAQDSFQHTNDISRQVHAAPFSMEDILAVQPINNCQTSIPSYPESEKKITIISGSKVIQLDPAEATKVFTASGLGMLMESSEINDNPPSAPEHEPMAPMAIDYQSEIIPTSLLDNSFMDTIHEPFPINGPSDLSGAEYYQPANIAVPDFRPRPGDWCDTENYITSLDDTQIELRYTSSPFQAQFDNTRNVMGLYEPSNPVNANQSHAYPSSTVADKYPSIRPKQSAPESRRNVDFTIKVKRTRNDRGKKRNKGNNTTGRQGKLRCGQCRARNSMCIYTHEYMPCTFCSLRGIKEPCFKLHGPKKEAILAPSRPTPAAIDDILDGKEVLRLQYLFCSPNWGFMFGLLGKLPARYGPALSCLSVRYSALALASFSICAEECGHYQALARRELNLRLHGQSPLDSSDLVAAVLLALLAFFTSVHESLDEVHVNSCLSIMEKYIPDKDTDLLLDMFDCLELFLAQTSQRRTLAYYIRDMRLRINLLGGEGSFQPCYAIAIPKQTIWESPFMAGIHLSLHRFICCLFFLVRTRLDEELLDYEPDTSLWSIRQRIESELGHQSFHDAINIAVKWPYGPRRERVILGLSLIHCLNALLEAPTLIEGLQIRSPCSAALDLLSILASASDLTSEEQILLDYFMQDVNTAGPSTFTTLLFLLTGDLETVAAVEDVSLDRKRKLEILSAFMEGIQDELWRE